MASGASQRPPAPRSKPRLLLQLFDEHARVLPALVEAFTAAEEAEASAVEEVERGQVAVGRAELEAPHAVLAGEAFEDLHQAEADAFAALAAHDGNGVEH